VEISVIANCNKFRSYLKGFKVHKFILFILFPYLSINSYVWADNTLRVTYESPEVKAKNALQRPSIPVSQVLKTYKIEVIKTDDLDKSTKELLEKGYLVIEQDTVKARVHPFFPDFDYKETVYGFKQQAKKLKTPIVVFTIKNQGLEPVGAFNSIPNKPQPPRKTNLSVNQVNHNTADLTTVAVPGTVNEYLAYYFMEYYSVTGIYPVNMKFTEINTSHGSGVKVISVSKGSPADGVIQENDIIQKINNDPTLEVQSFIEASNYIKKGVTILQILRNNEKMQKEIFIE